MELGSLQMKNPWTAHLCLNPGYVSGNSAHRKSCPCLSRDTAASSHSLRQVVKMNIPQGTTLRTFSCYIAPETWPLEPLRFLKDDESHDLGLTLRETQIV